MLLFETESEENWRGRFFQWENLLDLVSKSHLRVPSFIMNHDTCNELITDWVAAKPNLDRVTSYGIQLMLCSF